jgi:hypothetical protein
VLASPTEQEDIDASGIFATQGVGFVIKERSGKSLHIRKKRERMTVLNLDAPADSEAFEEKKERCGQADAKYEEE